MTRHTSTSREDSGPWQYYRRSVGILYALLWLGHLVCREIFRLVGKPEGSL